VAFGLVYGSLAGGFPSLWTGFTAEFASKCALTADQPTNPFILAEEDPRLSTTLIGYLMFSRGIGNILSTPISTALSHPYNDPGFHRQRLGFEVGGGRFEDIIIYAGTCFAGAAIIAGVGWVLEMRKKSLRNGH
jgi:MFS transporter, MCT family, solute carrier family 16 (monocarboxylic acid transporters), member 10